MIQRALRVSRTISPEALIAAGFLLALWIATHPYLGVIHDARLYLLQSLHALEPEKWSRDLFFEYGTQDAFSLFSSGYKWVVAALGISGANLTATIIGDVSWLAGLGFLVCTILRHPAERLAAVCGVLALDSGYGGVGVFHYAEPFITPRLFAEAAIMGGLAFAARGRNFRSSMLFLLAFAMHPLVTIPGIGLLALYVLRRAPRFWIALGLFLAVGVAGAAVGIDPFARLLAFYDDGWFGIIEGRTNFALIGAWNVWDYAWVGSAFLVLGAFLKVADDQERSFVVSLMIVGVTGLVVSFLGADLGRNVLIMNLQLWRAMWLVGLASNGALFLLILRSSGPDRVALIAAAVLSILSHFLFRLGIVAPFAIVLCLLWLFNQRLPDKRIRLGVCVLLLVMVAFALPLGIHALRVQLLMDPHIARRLTNLSLAMVSIIGCVWSMRHPPEKWLIVVAIGVLAVTGSLVDQRTSWNRYVYGADTDDDHLGRFLMDSGTTYWEGANGTEVLWFRAGRPSFYSCLQGTESMFFRPQAMEWSRRKSALQHLNTEDFGDVACGLKVDRIASGSGPLARIAAACQALPDLDTIIVNHPVPGLPNRSWTAPAYQEIIERDFSGRNARDGFQKVSTFYRYSCAALRSPPAR